MNLNDFDTKTRAEQGVELELLSIKTGKPSGNFITVLGRDSDAWRESVRARRMDEVKRAEAGITTPRTQAELDDIVASQLAGVTRSWRGPAFVNDDGSPAICDFTSARDVYLRYPAIREQVDVFIGERANFVLP